MIKVKIKIININFEKKYVILFFESVINFLIYLYIIVELLRVLVKVYYI